jgi:hypothetical protein
MQADKCVGSDHKLLSFSLGIIAIVGVVFNVLGLGVLRDAALGIIFLLWAGWWIWLLVLLVGEGTASGPPARGH